MCQDLIDEAATDSKYGQCWHTTITLEHSGFRFQIIKGALWVYHLPWHNYPGGVVPRALTNDWYNKCAASWKKDMHTKARVSLANISHHRER